MQECAAVPRIDYDEPDILFTDIEGSTMLWERFPDRMKSALAGTTPYFAPRSKSATAAREALKKQVEDSVTS
jgi:class 3 adenylate cyclase